MTLSDQKNILYETHDIKLLPHLKLNFSHLNEHKFQHNLKDTINSFMTVAVIIDNGHRHETVNSFYMITATVMKELTQCAVVVLSQKLQITIYCAAED